MSESTSVISGRNRDCTGCRIVSGTGLIGAGLYIAYHSQKLHKTIGKTIGLGIAGTSIALGLSRIFDLPPFRHQFESD